MKRKQILIPNWMDDYIEESVQMHDWNYSEFIRVGICVVACCVMNKVYLGRECNCINKIAKAFSSKIRLNRDDIHKLIEDTNFELRKTIDLCKEKRTKKIAKSIKLKKSSS